MALANQVFCITGKFSETRDVIKSLIEENGGTVVSAMSGKVTTLVCEGDEGSSKYNDALKKGIPIESEAWLRAQISGGGGGGGKGKKGAAAAAAAAPAPAKGKKGKAAAVKEEEEEEEEVPEKKAAKGKKAAAPAKHAAGGSPLAGMVFCVTGAFKMGTRSKVEQAVILAGGECRSAVTKEVTHLLCENEESSAKRVKAEERGIPILDEAWLVAQISGGGSAGGSGDGDDEEETAGPPAKKAKKAPVKKEPAPKKAAPAAKNKKAAIKEEEDDDDDDDDDEDSHNSDAGVPLVAPSKPGSASTSTSSTTSSSSSTSGGGGASVFDSIPLAPLESIVKVSKFPPAIDVGSEPYFPKNYTIRRVVTLNQTNIANNNNKFYCLECHVASENGRNYFRIYAHYGRTDEVANNPKKGVRQVRMCSSLDEVESVYKGVLHDKSVVGDYREVNLVSANIGSELLKGRATGTVDSKTTAKIANKTAAGPKASLGLNPMVTELVRYLYEEATKTLTKSVNVQVTAKGLETPLGVLTVKQVETGEAILDEIAKELNGAKRASKFGELSNDFYSTIPSKFGDSRARAHGQAAIINTHEMLEEKRSTCQLMKDMLEVEGVLFDDDIDEKYKAMNCEIEYLDKNTDEFKRMFNHVINSQKKTHGITVVHIYKVKRAGEYTNFRTDIPDVRELFHGSRVSNWVGLLTRGILMPKQVVALGGKRTDGGWLGSGIYFGDTSCTSAFYTNAGSKKTRFMAVSDVALGRIKDYSKITYGLESPPPGYDSCHGVRGTEFEDDEYVVYEYNRSRLTYLVEFTTTDYTYFH